MTKHIGIVAVSAEGAALCYRTICLDAAPLLGRHAHPQITMHTYCLADYMQHIEQGSWDEVARLLLSSAAILRQAGAQFLICPDNTAHQALDLIRWQSPLPWLHIAEEVATVANQRGFRRILILGTRYLMEGPVYPAKLLERGIRFEIPEQDIRKRVNQMIFDELVCGSFQPDTRAFFSEAILNAQKLGCDAVVLGCTEIPLLIGDSDSALPILDSTRILASAALREATQLDTIH